MSDSEKKLNSLLMLVELETSRGRNEVELEGVALGPKGRFAMQRTLTRVRPREGATKWSWRESNPRPSKQGNHTLSTRLSWTSFSCCSKTQATNCNLIL